MYEQLSIRWLAGLFEGSGICPAAEEYLGDIYINPDTLEIQIR